MGFDSRCPEVDPPLNPIHLPHETSCEYFYKCSNRHIFLFPCPPGLHWSIQLDRCEWPWIANCDPAMLPPLGTTTGNPIQNECPPRDDPNFIVFLNDFSRCDGYYLCFNGNKIHRTCSSGLHWNNYYRWCDKPENVQCILE